MTRPLALLPAACAALIISLTPSWARAQDEPPAHIAVVDGSATIEREATADLAAPNTPLVAGDRVRTDRGRVEILFRDGVVLHLDEQTTMDVQDRGFVRLLTGRAAIVSLRDRGDLQVDTPAGSVRVGPGVDMRIALVSDDREAMEVFVMRGEVQVWTDRGSTLVAAGYRVLAVLDQPPSQASPFNSAAWTDFDRWSQDRIAARRATASYQYVPPALQAYGGIFDTYGTWGYEPVYGGYVWYPRVAAGWRPYYDGRWRFYAGFGWTWIGGSIWNWPTHHYGRWGLSRTGAWYWVPGPRWAPAYVQWAVAPGYVSWCPIGFNNRPVVPFWDRHAVPRGSVWHAWTVLPRRSFERNHFVHRAAIDGSRLFGRGTAPAFVTQATAPAPVAIPRAGVVTGGLTPGGRSAVGVAVPRSGGYITYRGGTVEVPSADRNPAPRPPRPGATVMPRTGSPAAPALSASPSNGGRVSIRRGDPRAADRPASDPSGVGRRTVDPRAMPAAPSYRTGRAVPRSRAPIVNRPAGAPAIPDATAPRSRRPAAAWSPDQVPVYRGGQLSPPAYGPGPSGPTAVPRGYGIDGGARRAMPAAPGRMTAPSPMMRQPPSSGMRIAPPAGMRTAPPAGMRSAPPAGMRSAPPAGMRSAPPSGGRGYAVPRGSTGGPPPAAAPSPSSSAPASSGHSRRR